MVPFAAFLLMVSDDFCVARWSDLYFSWQSLLATILLCQRNRMCWDVVLGCFDSRNIVLYDDIQWFRGEMMNLSATTKSLWCWFGTVTWIFWRHMLYLLFPGSSEPLAEANAWRWAAHNQADRSRLHAEAWDGDSLWGSSTSRPGERRARTVLRAPPLEAGAFQAYKTIALCLDSACCFPTGLPVWLNWNGYKFSVLHDER